MKLVIVENSGGNLLSVTTAFQRLGIESVISHDKDLIAQSDALVLPGVGAAGVAMHILKHYDLVTTLKNYKKPVLGICLGLQLLYEFSEEDQVECLGIIKGRVKKFAKTEVVVPHMGWNDLTITKDNQLLNEIETQDNVYYVHSYYVGVSDVTLATCNYGTEFSAVIQQDNFYAMQFHPEKSGELGSKLLNNFIGIVNDSLSSN